MHFRAFALGVLVGLFSSLASFADNDRPNILWLVQEDLSPWLGCYGHEVQQGQTPHIDGMAARGVRFSRAYVPCPVCSPCRSSFIVGANQIRFGAHEHRSRRGEAALPLPEGMQTIPELLGDAGYFCFNIGKTDYNFTHDGIYSTVPKNQNGYPWRACPQDKPFFGQIQLRGGKINTKKFKNKTDRSKVTIPGDYPQNELYREIVAEHYDSARMDDGNVGKILEQLKKDSLLENTIVVYFSDHGANQLVRHKQQPTEAGLHVPFIITGPKRWVRESGVVRDELVSILDLTATTVSWAGVEKPNWFEGQDLFGQDYQPAKFIGSARDRCDQTIERIRSIRTDKFRYTRNFLLDRVLLQPQYRDRQEYVKYLRQSYAGGTLKPKLAEIYFGERPAEELYDIENDPAQLNNLANNPEFDKVLDEHRKLMDQWLAKGDQGANAEPDIELTMNGNGKKWGEGVNVEYERVRNDFDGDGLSDNFEKANGLDPNDGIVFFGFDCGGWQTEGWTTAAPFGNLAGSQGYLDFVLPGNEGSNVSGGGISRSGLSVDAGKNRSMAIRIKVSKKMSLFAGYNGQKVSSPIGKIEPGEFVEIDLPDLPDDVDTLETITLMFSGEPGTQVTIDWIGSKR